MTLVLPKVRFSWANQINYHQEISPRISANTDVALRYHCHNCQIKTIPLISLKAKSAFKRITGMNH